MTEDALAHAANTGHPVKIVPVDDGYLIGGTCFVCGHVGDPSTVDRALVCARRVAEEATE